MHAHPCYSMCLFDRECNVREDVLQQPLYCSSLPYSSFLPHPQGVHGKQGQISPVLGDDLWSHR